MAPKQWCSNLVPFLLKGKGRASLTTNITAGIPRMDRISERKRQLLTTRHRTKISFLLRLVPAFTCLPRGPKALEPGLGATGLPVLPLLCPLGHLLLSCLAAVGQAVGAPALGLALRGQLLAELLQLPLVHEPLLLQGAPLFLQVLLLQDLNHILHWVW